MPVASGSGVQRLVKRLGRGWGLWRLWQVPRSYVQAVHRKGLVNHLREGHDLDRMRNAARELPPLAPSDGTPVTLHFLTGEKFWQETIFCAWTFAHHAKVPVRLELFDDGSLTPATEERFRRLFPDTVVHGRGEVEERLDRALPATRYPTLRALRVGYVHLRKLTDVHAGQVGWRLVCDSDLLFYRRPDFLLEWLRSPTQPLFMKDMMDSYGYTLPLLQELAQAPIPERFNVGLAGQRSDAIDWDRLEFMARSLVEKEGYEYLLEQTLTMLLAAARPFVFCPEPDYLSGPSKQEVLSPKATMHHFVGNSKAAYRQHGWRRASQ
jgi:hypothetical protein